MSCPKETAILIKIPGDVVDGLNNDTSPDIEEADTKNAGSDTPQHNDAVSNSTIRMNTNPALPENTKDMILSQKKIQMDPDIVLEGLTDSNMSKRHILPEETQSSHKSNPTAPFALTSHSQNVAKNATLLPWQLFPSDSPTEGRSDDTQTPHRSKKSTSPSSAPVVLSNTKVISLGKASILSELPPSPTGVADLPPDNIDST
eukprot:CAMPEP_0172518522 /NCGR_PEP_ID=MMETSP1066-20121228/290874_1 /TAXON_ID=671091 /ORGANISM="Coscinodiscus wailesii, Strain CCMP2513" /LENGTH=201 /DNA_ID=CAMNT_0013300939 /DNA_START=680 /DNA_END=1285 /DNA_ORIENTATION=-